MTRPTTHNFLRIVRVFLLEILKIIWKKIETKLLVDEANTRALFSCLSFHVFNCWKYLWLNMENFQRVFLTHDFSLFTFLNIMTIFYIQGT